MAQDERGGSLERWTIITLGVTVLAAKAKQARDIYVEEVSSGSKPIEGVGTAVACFVGLLPSPGGTQDHSRRDRTLIGLGMAVLVVRAKRARDAYVEEVSSGSKPIEGVGTAVACFVGLAG